MSNFTPGPWKIVERSQSLIVEGERYSVAVITAGLDDDSNPRVYGDIAKANARLIADAPNYWQKTLNCASY